MTSQGVIPFSSSCCCCRCCLIQSQCSIFAILAIVNRHFSSVVRILSVSLLSAVCRLSLSYGQQSKLALLVFRFSPPPVLTDFYCCNAQPIYSQSTLYIFESQCLNQKNAIFILFYIFTLFLFSFFRKNYITHYFLLFAAINIKQKDERWLVGSGFTILNFISLFLAIFFASCFIFLLNCKFLSSRCLLPHRSFSYSLSHPTYLVLHHVHCTHIIVMLNKHTEILRFQVDKDDDDDKTHSHTHALHTVSSSVFLSLP